MKGFQAEGKGSRAMCAVFEDVTLIIPGMRLLYQQEDIT